MVLMELKAMYLSHHLPLQLMKAEEIPKDKGKSKWMNKRNYAILSLK